MELIFRKSLAKRKQAIAVLALLLPILIVSSKFTSQPVGYTSFASLNPNLASDPINYTIGVSPNEEYDWIITSIQESYLELLFGSNWTEILGLFGVPQIGYKFKVNISLVQSNETHYSLGYGQWDCLYRTDIFSEIPDYFSSYDYPVFPQNCTNNFELSAVFPLFLPIPLVSYLFEANLTTSYYDASDFTSYGGGLYVYYDRQINISGSIITIDGMASYLENGALNYFRFYYVNGSDRIECLSIESFEPYHLKQASMSCQVGDEFMWVLVNYNLTVLEKYFGEEFFEKYGLLPHPERMQSIKMKVEGLSENDTSVRVDYSLYNWTSLEESVSISSAKNSSYAYEKEPFNELRSTDCQIPFLIPEPTELFLRYGRFGDQYAAYYDLYNCIMLRFNQGEETLFGVIFYNRAGVLTTMLFTRTVQIGGRTEVQIAFELALYYDSPTPDYVGIEEGTVFNYDIYTNESINANLAFPTKNYQNATVEVVKIFGEDKSAGRTSFVANFSMQGDYNLWELEDVLIVGHIHNDSNMYFDPLIISSLGPFYLGPLLVNNKMNWTDFSASYNNYSIIRSSNYYSVSELPSGFNLYHRDNVNNFTFSYNYNESGVLTEFIVYYNDYLYHNCTLGKIRPPPIEIDTDPPVIAVFDPSSEKLFGINPPVFNLTVKEEHLNCTWLSLFNGTIRFTQDLSFTGGGSMVEISRQISQTYWDCFSDGNLTVRFYANDSSGNLDWEEIIVIKDITAPTISILNLIHGDTFNNTAPEFVLAITELHLNSTWYTVNGSECIYFTDTLGTIDQALWGSLSNGSVSIQFFALDGVGNLGTAEVVVIKQVNPESSPTKESGETIESLTTIMIQLSLGMIGLATVLLLTSRRRKRN